VNQPQIFNAARSYEVTLDIETFQKLAKLAHDEAGLAIEPGKLTMVQTRLAPRLRKLGFRSFSEYLKLVSSTDGQSEKRELISALTTNISNFFREPHHFDLLAKKIGPELVAKQKLGQRIRIWSAGCSNGQEPLSIAMTLIENKLVLPNSDVRILATDIDTKVIRFAIEALYSEQMINGLTLAKKERFFNAEEHDGKVHWRAKDIIQSLVSYKELNILDPWPMTGSFDVILCRNVVIYFDQETQNQLWKRFACALTLKGRLLLGHSERISAETEGQFITCGTTAYQKIVSDMRA